MVVVSQVIGRTIKNLNNEHGLTPIPIPKNNNTINVVVVVVVVVVDKDNPTPIIFTLYLVTSFKIFG